MQRATEAMKSSQTGDLKGGSDLNRSRRSTGCGLNATERRSQAFERCIQRIDRPFVVKMPPSIYLQAAAKLDSTGHILARSKCLIGLSKPRQTSSIPLPPISGSRTISGKVRCTDALPASRLQSAKTKGYRTNLPTGNVMTEKTDLHVSNTQCKKVNQESNHYNKISVALVTGNKEAIRVSETRSRLIKQTFDGQPAATLTSAPVDSPIQQKNDASGPGASGGRTMMPIRTKHDASLCKTRQQRDFCSDDSAIETESGGSEDKGCLERLKDDSDDEYYTDQRITEWVLTVNASLFSDGNDDIKRSEPVQEQDIGTIKIVYRGD